MENDCECSSYVLHSNDHKSPEEDAELVYSQPPSDTWLNRSDELFYSIMALFDGKLWKNKNFFWDLFGT